MLLKKVQVRRFSSLTLVQEQLDTRRVTVIAPLLKTPLCVGSWCTDTSLFLSTFCKALPNYSNDFFSFYLLVYLFPSSQPFINLNAALWTARLPNNDHSCGFTLLSFDQLTVVVSTEPDWKMHNMYTILMVIRIIVDDFTEFLYAW